MTMYEIHEIQRLSIQARVSFAGLHPCRVHAQDRGIGSHGEQTTGLQLGQRTLAVGPVSHVDLSGFEETTRVFFQ